MFSRLSFSCFKSVAAFQRAAETMQKMGEAMRREQAAMAAAKKEKISTDPEALKQIIAEMENMHIDKMYPSPDGDLKRLLRGERNREAFAAELDRLPNGGMKLGHPRSDTHAGLYEEMQMRPLHHDGRGNFLPGITPPRSGVRHRP